MFRSKLPLLLLHLLLVAVVSVVEVRAQAVYGSISGTVTDTAGAVVPGATITIRSIERNTTDVIESNDSGLYVQERLIPGTYEVKVEKTGFKQSIVTPVRVNVDTSSNTDVALETGQVTETVTVSGSEGELLKTDRADVATTFESRQLTELPILDRNFTKLHSAHAGHTAARLAARGEREPARLDADHGQWPALQRHRLSTRRHREPRPDSRHHRHQPEPRSRSAKRRSPRRTTTPNSVRRSPASFRCRPNRARTSSTAARSFSGRTTCCKRAIPFRSSTADPVSRANSFPTRFGISSGARSAGRSSGTSCSSSATIRERAARSAARAA